MKKLLPFLLLIFAAGTFAQASRYDKFKDETRVAVDVSGGGIVFWVSLTHSGQTLPRNQQQFDLFFTGAMDRSVCHGFCFRNPELIMLIDGEREWIGGKRNHLSDTVLWLVDRKLIERLAAARTIEWQAGRFEGKLTPPQIAEIGKLLEYGTRK